VINVFSRNDVTSLTDVLAHWANEQPNARAFVFLKERGGEDASLTFGQLEERVKMFAALIAARAQPGDRAILLFQPGLDFIVAFFGCLQAGVIAVPMMVPRRMSERDSSAAIFANCSPRLLITNRALRESRPDVVERLRDAPFNWLLTDGADDINPAAPNMTRMARGRDDIAFLQYTSGSTSTPKGVMVSHGNLIDNIEMIRRALGATIRATCVCWIPLYHDMGLILNALASFYVGANCVLMAPGAFMQRPVSWLRAIHHYRAEVAGAPNFAFDLCVSRFREEHTEGLDLSCWRVAYNAAEPVRADTLERFAAKFAPYGFDRNALCAFYGLAEATVLVSGGRTAHGAVKRNVSRASLQRHLVSAPLGDADRYALIGCGRAVTGQQLAIVDPQTKQELGECRIGEIWLSGPNVAQGYWKNVSATRETFHAAIEGHSGTWLRTGDLGFLDEDGELFVTGRIKDVIIIRGINHYPQDIENTTQNSHPALQPNCGAAFAAVDEEDNEALVIVHEVERAQRHHLDVDEIVGAIREAVVNEHEIAVGEIVLVRPGALPKTTSGKVQRNLTRLLWQQGRLDVLSDQAGRPRAAGR
jgi:acyl-CoA synthetase (AMP-forming)/AMP-acid ligase II